MRAFRTWCVAGVLSLGAGAIASAQTHAPSDDAAAIYGSVLTKLFEYGSYGEDRRFVLDTTIRLPVGYFALDTTHLWRVVDPSYREPIGRLLAINQLPAERVHPHPSIPGARLVPTMPLDSTLDPTRSPRCAVAQSSPVGFDEKRRYAAVFVLIQCNDSGHGELVLLERTGSSWRIVRWMNVLALG